MEKRAPDPIIILKVNTNCCKNCPGELQKALLEISGVNQAVVDPQKNLVSIRGNANPYMLIEEIAKMNKAAILMFYDKEPKLEGHRQKNVRFAQENHPSTDDHHKQNSGKDGGHEHFSCDDDGGGEGFIHKDIGEENVPSWGSENIFGSHSDYPRQTHFRTESSKHDTRNRNYSRWFWEEPPPYDHQRWRMPPPPPPSSYFYGPFRGRRPMSQCDHFPH